MAKNEDFEDTLEDLLVEVEDFQQDLRAVDLDSLPKDKVARVQGILYVLIGRLQCVDEDFRISQA